MFRFRTDAPFNADVPGTWPTQFQWQLPNVQRYEARELALFVQDDWRAGSRLRVNAGLRYDLDPTLRINDFYAAALPIPALAGLETFVSGDRGTDTNNVQPRLGRHAGRARGRHLVLRGGWGMYVDPQPPVVPAAIDESARLARGAGRRSRAVAALSRTSQAILAGSAAQQLGTVIPDDFVQAYSRTTRRWHGWQLGGATTLNWITSTHTGIIKTGSTDRNLPTRARLARAIQAGAAVRPGGDARELHQELVRRARIEFRTRLRGARATACLVHPSRTWLDGVDFFLTSGARSARRRNRASAPATSGTT